jgi:hypothetical protein
VTQVESVPFGIGDFSAKKHSEKLEKRRGKVDKTMGTYQRAVFGKVNCVLHSVEVV